MKFLYVVVLFLLLAACGGEIANEKEKVPEAKAALVSSNSLATIGHVSQSCKTGNEISRALRGYEKIHFVEIFVKNNSETELLKFGTSMFEMGLSNGTTQLPLDATRLKGKDETVTDACPDLTSVTPLSEIRCRLGFSINAFYPYVPTKLYFRTTEQRVSPNLQKDATLSFTIDGVPKCESELICVEDSNNDAGIVIRPKKEDLLVTGFQGDSKSRWHNCSLVKKGSGRSIDPLDVAVDCYSPGRREPQQIRVDGKTLRGVIYGESAYGEKVQTPMTCKSF